jgi:hypothetical protein
MGSVKTFVGRPADTVPLLRTAMRLNPASGSLYFLVLGRAYLFLGDLEQAQVNLEQALMRNPESLEAHIYLVMAARKGDGRWSSNGFCIASCASPMVHSSST